MGHEGLKLELIEWLTKLEDGETIQYLKEIKDSKPNWWDDLDSTQKKGIEKGLKDIDEGRVIPHDEVRKKYGL